MQLRNCLGNFQLEYLIAHLNHDSQSSTMVRKSQFRTDYLLPKSWSNDLAPVAIEDQLIAGFYHPEDAPTFVYPKSTPSQHSRILIATVKDWDWLDTFSIHEKCIFFDLDILLQATGLSRQSFHKLLPHLPSFAPPFKHLLREKKVLPHDLAFLFGQAPLHSELMEQIARAFSQWRLSKMEILKNWEWLFELVGMEKDVKPALHGPSPDEIWKLRFPNSAAREAQELKALDAIPKQLKAQYLRRGDLTGLQFSVFAESPERLRKISDQLRLAANNWESAN